MLTRPRFIVANTVNLFISTPTAGFRIIRHSSKFVIAPTLAERKGDARRSAIKEYFTSEYKGRKRSYGDGKASPVPPPTQRPLPKLYPWDVNRSAPIPKPAETDTPTLPTYPFSTKAVPRPFAVPVKADTIEKIAHNTIVIILLLFKFTGSVADNNRYLNRLMTIFCSKCGLCLSYECIIQLSLHEVDGTTTEATTHDA